MDKTKKVSKTEGWLYTMNEETLLHDALTKTPAERTAFLDAACAGKPELRAAVETLLASHEATGGFVDLPPSDLAATVESTAPQLTGAITGELTLQPDPASTVAGTADRPIGASAGLVISGRYKLEGRIGEGGMGEVWVAKQTEPVKRQVALKLIKPGMDSRAVLQRFEQERQALRSWTTPISPRCSTAVSRPTDNPFSSWSWSTACR